MLHSERFLCRVSASYLWKHPTNAEFFLCCMQWFWDNCAAVGVFWSQDTADRTRNQEQTSQNNVICGYCQAVGSAGEGCLALLRATVQTSPVPHNSSHHKTDRLIILKNDTVCFAAAPMSRLLFLGNQLVGHNFLKTHNSCRSAATKCCELLVDPSRRVLLQKRGSPVSWAQDWSSPRRESPVCC